MPPLNTIVAPGGGFRAPQGALLAAEGGMVVKVEVNTGDIAKLHRKLNGMRYVINPELWNRARNMTSRCVAALNNQAPKGEGVGWRRGSPPLSQSHHGAVINAYEAVVWTDAPHAQHIIFGFAPHMPPEEAWVGQQELSFVMRRAVLHNGTPENPRDYWTPVVTAMQAYNETTRNNLEARVKAAADAG